MCRFSEMNWSSSRVNYVGLGIYKYIMSELDWLQVGSSWKLPPKTTTEQPQEPDERRSPKKKKKHRKEKKKKEIVVQQVQLNLYKPPPTITEEIKKGFVYKFQLSKDVLSIQNLPFGFQEIYLYGHKEQEVPRYARVDCNILLGLPSNAATQAFLEELAIPLAQRYTFTQARVEKINRYTTLQFEDTKFQIGAVELTDGNQEFIQFNSKIQPNTEQDFKQSQELQVVKESRELQTRIQEDVNDLNTWKRFLHIQEKMAELQGYNTQASITSRRLAIIEKLQQQSEVLADHPWVLAYKIYMLQDLVYDEDIDQQIIGLWDTLLHQYLHIQPIWTLHLNQRLRSEKFIATAFRAASVQTIEHLKQLQYESKRPQQIAQYKRIYIELIQYISFQEHEMGFKERAVGIIQGLVELNLFTPFQIDSQVKMDEFRERWEEYHICRTGYLMPSEGSNDQQSDQTDAEFIGKFESEFIMNEERPLKHQWRPQNSAFDQDYIQLNVDSLVLFEDIENYLNIYNDVETKVQLFSALLEQLGFPPLSNHDQPQMNSYYMAKLSYRITKEELRNQCVTNNLDIFSSDLLLEFTYLLQYFKGTIKGPQVEKFMYVRRILTKVKDVIRNERFLGYLMVIEGILYLNAERLQQFYPQESFPSIEITQSHQRIKSLLKSYGEEFPMLWILYIEFDFQKKSSRQQTDRMFKQVLSFAKTQKKRLHILYFMAQFYLRMGDFSSICSIVKQVVQLLGNDPNDMSLNLAIIKIRGHFISQKNQNKLANPLKLEKQKGKAYSLFNISKKAILHSLILLLDFLPLGQTAILPQPQDIENHFMEIEMETHVLQRMFFQDPETKLVNIIKFANEMFFLFLNFSRYVSKSTLPLVIKQDILKRISSRGIQHNPNSLIFFTLLVNELQNKGLYFLKFQNIKEQVQSIMRDENLFRSTHAVWMIYILLAKSELHSDELRKESKLGYLSDFILIQLKKTISQLYCESSDQETFEAFNSILYGCCLEKILLAVSAQRNKVESFMQDRAQKVKLNSFSQVPIVKRWRELCGWSEGQINFN